MAQDSPEDLKPKSNRDLFIETFTRTFREAYARSGTYLISTLRPAAEAYNSDQDALRADDPATFRVRMQGHYAALGEVLRSNRDLQDAEVALDAAEEVAGTIYDREYADKGVEWSPPEPNA